MTAVRIDGKGVGAEDSRGRGGRARVRELVCLATILVGDDPASHVYVGSKHKASHEAGIDSRDHRFPADTPESDILDLVAELNADDAVDGILVQLLPRAHGRTGCPPLRGSGQGRRRLPHPERRTSLPRRAFLVPATPLGIMAMLAEYGVELKGKEAVVIGGARSSASRWRCCCSPSTRR